jgi:phosphocarrier protein
MKFVELAQGFQADIQVCSETGNGEKVDGKSAMELMLLGATAGTGLLISASGPDAERAVSVLAELVNNRFNQDS